MLACRVLPRMGLLVASCALLVFATAPPAGAKPARLTIKVTSTEASYEDGVSTLLWTAGYVPGHTGRRVEIDVQSRNRWNRVAVSKSSANHRYIVRLPTKFQSQRTVKLRARATRTHSNKQLTSRSIDFRVPVNPFANLIRTPASLRPSYRAVYLLPVDQLPIAEVVSAIRSTAEAANFWFSTQTFGAVQPRWVRDASGQIVVTTINLPQVQSAYNGEQPTMYDTILHDFSSVAHLPGNQRTVAWIPAYETDIRICGRAANPLITIYLSPYCRSTANLNDSWPSYSSMVTAHEITHSFGAVPACAPHFAGNSHSVDQSDLMWERGHVGGETDITLDPGHDDYYGTGDPSCPGIESSEYWTATADPHS